MKKLHFILTLIFVTLIFGCAKQTANQKNWVQKILDSYNDSLQMYGIVALVDNGTTLDTASVGYSFEKNKISTKNRFCIGSCTKMYTATLVLKLHEQGLYQINTKSRYFDSAVLQCW